MPDLGRRIDFGQNAWSSKSASFSVPFSAAEAKMSKNVADKRNRAVESQRVTATNGDRQAAGATAEAQRRLEDALEDDEVREALKRHAGQQNG
jgi:hypothetical protein